MADDLLDKLKNIDKATLTRVVQKEQDSQSFELDEWAVRRLSDKGVMNPDGLWLFSGQGHDYRGSRPWSVVLKTLFVQKDEPPLDDTWHWKREFFLAQSRFTETMPGPVKAPSFYETEETSEGAWIWMEHIINTHSDPWSLDDYKFAAHQLGQWNGTYLLNTPLPNEPWLTRQQYRSWLSLLNHDDILKFPLNKQLISENTKIRYKKLWDKHEIFYTVFESLPQVFSHFDCNPRNVFTRVSQNGQNELVLIDWAVCGLGPVGAELNELVGGGAMVLDWPSSDLTQLDTTVFQSYMEGLYKAGWSGNPDIVRLGFVGWLAVWFGCIFPSWTTWWCASEHREFALQICGVSEEELFRELLPVLHYSLDCADEARLLMKKLKFS